MSNVSNYKELELELASRLEAQYQYLMFSGDILGAYQVLGKLMAYKLIDRTDERLDPKFKVFKKAGINIEDRFKYDLRKDSSYLPEWLFADLTHSFETNFIAEKHLGTCVEAYYEAEMVYPDKSVNVSIKLLNTARQARDAANEICNIYLKQTGKELKIGALANELANGYARAYEINIVGNCISRYRNLGYILVYKNIGSEGFTSFLALKHTAFINSFIDIKASFKTLGRDIKKNINLGDNLSIKLLINPEKAVKEQEKFMRDNREKIRSYLDLKGRLVKEKIDKEKLKEEKKLEKEQLKRENLKKKETKTL